MSPLQTYQNLLSTGEIKPDLLQNEVILACEELFQNLRKVKKSWFFAEKKQFHGLYIYGTVGRGKTFLMDLFFNTIQTKTSRRQHYHEFMLWIHKQLHHIKKQQNPIDIIIKNLSKKISVLCLDEFLVNDITDAMLLAHILRALEKYGISLVTTSNVNPKDLYQGGLQRKKFIPAIKWMQNKLNIIQLDGNYDHRSTHVSLHDNWMHPINQENQNQFERKFSQLVAADTISLSPVTINKRLLEVIKCSHHHIMFEFDTLCKSARNADDYLNLAGKYQSIFIQIDAAIENEDRNTARRFITLIDVLYDHKTPLYVLSSVAFKDMYQGQELAFEMQRTLSRLTQMQ